MTYKKYENYRKKAGYKNDNAFAKSLIGLKYNIKQQTLNKWQHGGNASYEYQLLLAKALNIPKEEVF